MKRVESRGLGKLGHDANSERRRKVTPMLVRLPLKSGLSMFTHSRVVEREDI
jgi:hypothetical protein